MVDVIDPLSRRKRDYAIFRGSCARYAGPQKAPLRIGGLKTARPMPQKGFVYSFAVMLSLEPLRRV